MLIGEYRHTIDVKKRLSLPVKFRKELGKRMIITNGFDKCLFVYPEKEWSRVLEKYKNLSIGQAEARDLNRFLLGGAVNAEVDGLGRVLIPDFLKGFARLENKVALVGLNDRVEIWDEKTWDAYKKEIELKADALAERLGDKGAI
jgi:MraZ protein